MGDPLIALLLDGLDEAFDKKSWHGTNLRGSLRGVRAQQAVWKLAPGRHSIWELALHAAYWKHVVRHRILGEQTTAFLLEGSNFFPRQEGTEKEWQLELLLLDSEHRGLRTAVAGLNPKLLDQVLSPKLTYAQIIRGAAAHDLYHAGQIQLLKRLYPSPRTKSS